MVYYTHMAKLSKEVEQALIQEQDAFVWETPSFRKHERSKGWYFGLTIVTCLLVAYAVITSNFLFAFIVLLTVIFLLLMNSKQPRTLLVQLGTEGLVWDGTLHLYEDIDAFAIVYNPPHVKMLYIDFDNVTSPRLAIQLQDQDPNEMRAFLSQFLPENVGLREEPFSDTVGRLLKL